MSNTRKIKVKKTKEEEKVDELTLMIRESLKTMGRGVNPYQEKMLVNIYRMFIIGGVSTIIDVVLYFILYKFVKLDPMISNGISFVVSLAYGIWMSYKYAFSKKNLKSDLISYFLLAFLGLAVTEVLLWIFTHTMSVSPILIKILAVILVIVLKVVLKKIKVKTKKK